MSICVPNVAKVITLNDFLNDTLTMKLYSNDVTPDSLSVASDFTEVSGGGYADEDLLFANWVIAEGSPTRANYNTRFTWQFTGATASPSTIYGYYVLDSGGVLRWAERFPSTAIPFVPINGSIIKVRPRFSAGSIFND